MNVGSSWSGILYDNRPVAGTRGVGMDGMGSGFCVVMPNRVGIYTLMQWMAARSANLVS